MSAENIVTFRIKMSVWQRNFMYKFNIQIFVSFKIVFIPKICNKVFKAITSISVFLVNFFKLIIACPTFFAFLFYRNSSYSVIHFFLTVLV